MLRLHHASATARLTAGQCARDHALVTNQSPATNPEHHGLSLETLHGLLGEPATRNLFRALGVERLILSLDVNIAVQDVLRLYKRGGETSLLELLRSEFDLVLMSASDRAKVILRLAKLNRGGPAQLEAMRALWEVYYAPHIRTVDASAVPLEPRGERLQVRDANDLALAQLSRVVGADHLVTEDKDLHEYTRPNREWTKLMAAARMVVTQNGVILRLVGDQITVTVVVSVSFGALYEGARALVLTLNRILRQAPGVIVLLVGLLALGLVFFPKQRSALLQALGAMPGAIKAFANEHVWPWLEASAEQHVTAKRLRADAQAYLKMVAGIDLTDRSLRGYAVWVLARDHLGMEPKMLLEAVFEAGWRSRAQTPERYLIRVLRAHDGLFECQAGSWRLRVA